MRAAWVGRAPPACGQMEGHFVRRKPEGGCETEQPVFVRLALFICLLTRGLLPLKPPTPRGGDRLLWLLRPDVVARLVPDGRARTAPGPALARPGCRHFLFHGKHSQHCRRETYFWGVVCVLKDTNTMMTCIFIQQIFFRVRIAC